MRSFREFKKFRDISNIESDFVGVFLIVINKIFHRFYRNLNYGQIQLQLIVYVYVKAFMNHDDPNFAKKFQSKSRIKKNSEFRDS